MNSGLSVALLRRHVMKSFLLFLQFLFVTAQAQNKIVVQVNNFNNDKGICMVCLYDNAKAFSGKGEPFRILKVAVLGKTATAVFDNVPDGTYAIAVIHDANNNNRFDTNFMGLPTEGYGASKNKLPFAAAPRFEENKFSVDSNANTSLHIKLRYLF
ncbi:MAG TPA: DUF2141 domain-containing protein [Flavisolibacter sp.]|nr:DUF2141 domain-containing protein [Flavisolibacter sp.]